MGLFDFFKKKPVEKQQPSKQPAQQQPVQNQKITEPPRNTEPSVSNQKTNSKQSPPIQPSAPAAERDGAMDPSTDYVIQSGDTLSSLAKKFYGDPSRFREIYEANKTIINDPDKIYPGQKIKIPKNRQ